MENVRAHAQRIADALVDVIETARWDARISSLRGLAARAQMTHTALNARMRRETPFNVRDLAAVAAALGVEPNELLRRAVAAAGTRDRDPEVEASARIVNAAAEAQAGGQAQSDDEAGAAG